ncbi:FecCD family ABC transporter permease [Aureimonas phyllosphaerae]|uniref:Iron complex transport system permease protein n=1 Tax=Aureimonas phyllosphaerae TaxID=1166078 RepID=A0A7W6BXB7_9HYPH|nr:iron ABC transporter permease [Aureimonas phyllosphaerae]MBB3938120.1 iron complex transport system permease protein [Aureimonas phyllosphaerae]MBB3962147.1 iron complex transport system permease protein [Aureimonas phyllosphaerae]SFF56203.1 iron complex transport system permease protein [Aureimonas phyllosphaerae]
MVADVLPMTRRLALPGDRASRARLALCALAALTLATAVLALGVGPAMLRPATVTRVLLAGPQGQAASLADTLIVWQIRLPRVLLGALVGASLAAVGAMMQGLFRNPLADPGLVGVSSGAAFAAVAAIVLSGGVLAPYHALVGIYALPLAAFGGGLVATLLIYRIGTLAGRSSMALMLLAGIALGALAAAGTGFLVYMSNDAQLRDLTFWSLGGLGGANWTKLAAAGPMMLGALLCAPVLARGLNAIVLGEAEAFHMGVRVQALKRLTVVVVALATGAAVAVSGTIGFVGIVVPHLLRLWLGPDHRHLLPASILAGACLLLCADMVARLVVAPAELPIGILTAGIGAPVFLWILLRRRGVADL